MKQTKEISSNISTNQEEKINQILNLTIDIDKKITPLNEEKNKLDKRKEQLRKAQQKFKKLGCSVQEDVYTRFEELASKLNYGSTSAMCRSYLLLLLESKEFQSKFVEILLLESKEFQSKFVEIKTVISPNN